MQNVRMSECLECFLELEMFLELKQRKSFTTENATWANEINKYRIAIGKKCVN